MKLMHKWMIGAIGLVCLQVVMTKDVQALTNKAVTPEQYGANGKDKLLDTKALQKALDASTNVVLKGGATYYTNAPLTVNHNITISTTGGKAFIVKTNMKRKEVALHVQNPVISSTVLSNSIKKGQSFVEVKDASKIKAGDLLHLKSSKLWRWDNRGYLSKGELLRVTKVSGKKVYVASPLRDSYYVTGEKVEVTNYEKRGFVMENVSFSYPVPFDSAKELVRIDMTTGASLKGVEVRNSKRIGILLDRTYRTAVTNMKADLGTTPDISSGYGIQDYGGIYTRITNSYFTHVRRGIDFSGVTPSRFGYAGYNEAVGPEKNTLASGNSGFGTHSTAENIVFEHNKIDGFSYSFNSRGNFITFKNNEATGRIRALVAAGFGDNIVISNNKYTSKTGNAENFLRVVKTFDGKITLRNNYAGVLLNDFIQNDAPGLKGLDVRSNRGVFIHKGKSYAYLLKSLPKIALKNSVFQSNTLAMRQGKKAFSLNVNLTSKTNNSDKKY
ncbi:hypothetical protein CN918_27510 [Priestia megaterium]|nr:hypothetical protein CN918_27510 [Priestia megaterium]